MGEIPRRELTALSSQVKPEAQTACLPANKPQNNWDRLKHRLRTCVRVSILFAEACYCLEEETVYFSY